MIQTLLKNLLFCAIILSVVAVGQIFSQTTPNPVVKRNSPYSPNPKKKGETRNPPSAESERPVEKQSLNAEVQATPETLNNSKNEVPKINKTQNENFESRSVANKTLEIAKRANVSAVSPMEIYKIGAGDVLFISLQNAPSKESTYFTVLKDGTIDYPLAGEMVQVLGLTTEQIEDTLKEKIKLYENPLVSVKVREHNSHGYTVLGLVEKSGEKFMQREAIPLYVVRAEVIAQPKANRAVIKRNSNEPQIIDLKDSKSGDTLILPGDLVEFTSAESGSSEADSSQFYYIGGEIMTGGKKNYTNGITLTQAILESGGLKKNSVRKVFIRRKNENGLLISNEVDLKAIKNGRVADPVLRAGDTIEIGN